MEGGRQGHADHTRWNVSGLLLPEKLLDPSENHLIARLPLRSRKGLIKLCEPVQLDMAQVLGQSGKTMQHVYFPIASFISIITLLDGDPVLEVGLIGREGMLGAQMVLGVAEQALHAIVQGPGLAWRVQRRKFERELARNPELQACIARYLHVTMTQLAGSAACLRFHQIGPRLARWLLMTHDRAESKRFRVTHDFLALMLGVRRAGITTAAAKLQRQGLIEYRRGDLTVCDRGGLKRAACSCYATDRKTYRDLLQ